MKQVIAKVISNKQLLGAFERRDAMTSMRPEARNTLGSWLMWLECPQITAEAKPGQFVMVRCGDNVLPRPFGIHRTNDKGELSLFYNVWEDGKGTTWLADLRKGEPVELFGPLGNGFTIKPDTKNLLLVAGGTGIAPICFLAQYAFSKNRSVTLLYGASGEKRPDGVTDNPLQLYPPKLLPKGIDVQTIISSPDGKTRMVTELINLGRLARADQIIACGPLPMYRSMSQIPYLKGKSVQISLEIMMGCGVGVCYGCTIKTKNGLKQVCKDGPVFDLNDITNWDELII